MNTMYDMSSAGITHYHDGKKVATFYLDPWLQMDQVVLYPGASLQDEVDILRIAASHAMRYVVRREYSNVLLQQSYTGTVSAELSAEAFDDMTLHEHAVAMNTDELQVTLRKIGVGVVHASAMSIHDALELALSDPRLQALTVSCNIEATARITRRQSVTFSVEGPAQFKIWKHASKFGDSDLYIVPAYHPAVSNRTSEWLINGSTDALLRSRAVETVSAPHASILRGGAEFWMGTWSHINHPYYAAGNTITVEVSPFEILSREGVAEVVKLLLAMLEQDDMYVSVSGGFRGPYDHPENIARQMGLRPLTHDGRARGSESFCMWAYQVLADENELDGAYIPAWFKSEGWLSASKKMRVDQVRQ